MRIAILLAVVLAGCAAPRPYVRSETSSEQMQKDKLECEYDAAKATVGIRSGIEAGFQQGSLTDQCMRVRGYAR